MSAPVDKINLSIAWRNVRYVRFRMTGTDCVPTFGYVIDPPRPPALVSGAKFFTGHNRRGDFSKITLVIRLSQVSMEGSGWTKRFLNCCANCVLATSLAFQFDYVFTPYFDNCIPICMLSFFQIDIFYFHQIQYYTNFEKKNLINILLISIMGAFQCIM